MFLAFLALRHHDHATSALSEVLLSPDRDIVHAINTFTTFASEAQEQSRSASDALKYACQNWAIHLSRTPNPWNDMLNHKFQAFWNRHLLSWLERQWCLKGLRSCLVVLSEGQKLVKPNQVLPAIDPESQKSTMQASALASASELSTMATSTPILTPPMELVVAPHASVVPRPRLIQHTLWCPPSTPPLAPPLPPVASPQPETAVSYAGTSKKRMPDELWADRDSPLELASPAPSKRPKPDK
ncbi:hypothetical protein DFH29DRAFT_1080161 [Suillus ampliporus]|nr:hypothetical protein DFH29DRAFT_1080161 [Suillus ampliporus]